MRGRIAYSQEEMFERFIEEFNISGKKVLDIGGKLSSKSIALLTCDKWISIDLNNANRVINKHYEERKGDARFLGFKDNEFDYIFSCNSFEHIYELEIALSEMYRVLKKGGILYSNFGPIWSAPDGHHLDIKLENADLSFWKTNTIDLFEHLSSSEKEIKFRLEQKYGNEASSKIMKAIFNSGWINRYNFEKYIDIFVRSDFIIEDIMTNNQIDYSYDKHNYNKKISKLENSLYVKKNIRCRDVEIILRK